MTFDIGFVGAGLMQKVEDRFEPKVFFSFQDSAFLFRLGLAFPVPPYARLYCSTIIINMTNIFVSENDDRFQHDGLVHGEPTTRTPTHTFVSETCAEYFERACSIS